MERSRWSHEDVAAGSGEKLSDPLVALYSGRHDAGRPSDLYVECVRAAAGLCSFSRQHCGEVTWREAVRSPGGMHALLHLEYADDQIA